MMQGLAMARRIHVGDDKDSLFMHKYHMIQQTFSHSSKIVATNNLEILQGQNPLDWGVYYIIGKLLEHRCLKWALTTHLGT